MKAETRRHEIQKRGNHVIFSDRDKNFIELAVPGRIPGRLLPFIAFALLFFFSITSAYAQIDSPSESQKFLFTTSIAPFIEESIGPKNYISASLRRVDDHGGWFLYLVDYSFRKGLCLWNGNMSFRVVKKKVTGYTVKTLWPEDQACVGEELA